MSIKTVRRCIRPQCCKEYPEEYRSGFCDCGTLLKKFEIEILDSKPDELKPEASQMTENISRTEPCIADGLPADFSGKTAEDELPEGEKNKLDFDFFGKGVIESDKTEDNPDDGETPGCLCLIPENEYDDETVFMLKRKTLIGRSSDTKTVDVDLSQFGKDVSHIHALIDYDGRCFYITNMSQKLSVHINGKVLANGMKVKLNYDDSIILSKKIMLQFEEVHK